jgi:antitoxin (DNA-binding transcriptional repressor) of toxin-antitoxin stability system
MKTEIGAYMQRPGAELLRQVKAGKRFTITNRGEAIADLPSEAVAQMRRRRSKNFRHF